MARGKTKKRKPYRSPLRRMIYLALRICIYALLFLAFLALLGRYINPPTTYYMLSESRRLDGVKQEWVDAQDIAPVMMRSIVAAEDANFCHHWGFDLQAIKGAIAHGGRYGASTLTQQTVKNVYLWHARTYSRKALEALMTPLVESFWSKRRILEVYLNIAEFDEGVFGVKAAAQHYFGVHPKKLTAKQAARLAAVLPAPKHRSALHPSANTRKRTARIMDGAATIKVDGRAACFES